MSSSYVSTKIIMVSPHDVFARPGNPRTSSNRHKPALRNSIKTYGFTAPVLIDARNMIVAGAARVDAARDLGLELIPAIRLEHLSEAELLAYRIADNRVSDFSDWDRDLLPAAFQTIIDLEPTFDLTHTLFDVDEIELIRDLPSRKLVEKPIADLALPSSAVTRAGDLYEIGRHRLLCGSARRSADYATLLAREKADLVVTDPPYGCRINGHVSGLGKTKHREFIECSGEMSPAEFQNFLRESIQELVRYSRSGSLHYIFMDWRGLSDLTSVADSLYNRQINLAVWVKPSGGMGSFLRSRHELVVIYQRGKRAHINNVNLGAEGRYRTNVWEYPGASGFSATRDGDLAMHPTVKNLQMIEDAIKDASHTGDIVLDVFGGSGTTLVACESTGRVGRLIELDPLHCDVIVQRCLALGLGVKLAATNERFSDVQQRRGLEGDAGSVEVAA